MERSLLAQKQVIGILKQVEVGLKVPDACRKYGVSQWTFYTCRKKFEATSASESKRLKALEDKNLRLKRPAANPSLVNAALKDLLSKNPALAGLRSRTWQAI